jgi:A/G-specific adenine glycosylase
MNMHLSQDTLQRRLLAWYDRHRRVLPWRAMPGERVDAYRVWLSEIMLQQTTVAAVAGYFADFTRRWPSVADLASAELDEVLQRWAGLGYYARARNLHRCARIVARDMDGVFPCTADALLKLPGIGPYTAAAIAAIAFDEAVAAVDGNVERVVSRLFAIETPLPDAKPEIRAIAGRLVPKVRPGDFAQAMMDLGATVCAPRKANCLICPLAQGCQGRNLGIAETLPRKKAKPERPVRRGRAFWIERGDGAVLLRRREDKGLLGGMMEVPSTEWREAGPAASNSEAPVRGNWLTVAGHVEHTFSHFHLELEVVRTRIATDAANLPENCRWVQPHALRDEALPSVMKKVAVTVLGPDAFRRPEAGTIQR